MTQRPHPPRLATWLLQRSLPAEAFEAITGDLREDFLALAGRAGPRAGRRWYWRQTLASLAWQLRRRTDALRRPPDAPHAHRRSTLMNGLWQDTRFAVRILAKSPGFTLSAVLTLAIGIAGATTIMTAAGWALLRPLPFASPDQLVQVGEPNADGEVGNVGFETVMDWQARTDAFESLVPIRSWTPTLIGDDGAARLSGIRVGWQYFQMLGVRPALGRDFVATDDQPDQWRVVLVSTDFWRTRLGGQPDVIGQSLSFNGQAYEVIGVLPADFEPLISERFYARAEVWAPLGYARTDSFACRTCRHLRAVGRLAEDRDRASAAAELTSVHAQLEREHPDDYRAASPVLAPLKGQIVGRFERSLQLLMGAVGFVLLITCANVAGLIIARSADRQREMAVRAALGAGRRRIARQLLAESLVIAGAATALGVGAAKIGLLVLSRSAPADVIRLDQAAADPLVSLVAVTIGVTALLLFGLLPALDAARVDLQTVLRSTRQTPSHRSTAIREAMIVGQVAVALILVIGGGLMFRTVDRLLHVDPGFEPHGVLTAQMSLVGDRWAEDSAVLAFQQDLVDRVNGLPGVEAAGITGLLPLGGSYDRRGFGIVGQTYSTPDDVPRAERYSVTPGYFDVMGIRLRGGRLLDGQDTVDSEPVTLINETAVRTYWPDEDPVGSHVRFGTGPDSPSATVVGIVADVRHYDLETPPIPQIYMPQSQSTDSFPVLVIKTGQGFAGLADQVRAEVTALATDVPVYDVVSLEQLQTAAVGTRGLLMQLLGLFALVAVLLASVGLYGVISQSVKAREREIGIRLSLGAGLAEVSRVVVRRGLSLTAMGLVFGLTGAVLASRLLETQLFETQAIDPATYALATLALLTAGITAHLVPLRRALRVDPNVVLRGE